MLHLWGKHKGSRRKNEREKRQSHPFASFANEQKNSQIHEEVHKCLLLIIIVVEELNMIYLMISHYICEVLFDTGIIKDELTFV